MLAVGFAGEAGSYPLLLVFGFFLGIAGTIFAVGIPFANSWYDASRRGFATGVFGAGMVGTALSAFFTPRFVGWFGTIATHVIIAIALALTAVLCVVAMKNSPTFTPNTDKVTPKLIAACKLRVTWEMSFLYAIVFGGFVAFSNYLPRTSRRSTTSRQSTRGRGRPDSRSPRSSPAPSAVHSPTGSHRNTLC